jgi:hypothetical protein
MEVQYGTPILAIILTYDGQLSILVPFGFGMQNPLKDVTLRAAENIDKV